MENPYITFASYTGITMLNSISSKDVREEMLEFRANQQQRRAHFSNTRTFKKP